MIKFKLSRKFTVLTLFFFTWFLLTTNFNFAQEVEKDVLKEAKELYGKGDYDGSIGLLEDFIKKFEGEPGQSRKIAEAYYLMAKIHFDFAKDYSKVIEYLRKAFSTHPEFDIEEIDPDFIKEVEKLKREIEIEKKDEKIKKLIQESQEAQKKPDEKIKPQDEKHVDETNMIPKSGDKPEKKKFPWLIAVGGAVVIGTVLFLVLKKSKKNLAVSKGQGIDGSPESGNYKYKKNTTVSYSYSLQNGYTGLSVTLDGSQAPANGTITMDRDHTLNAVAYRQYTLMVTKDSGINGSPDAGTYIHKEGDIINYSYTLQSGYKDLLVKLDDSTVSANGSFTMNRDHTLSANATAIDQLPNISITNPKNGDTVNGEVTIETSVSDDYGIKQVMFYIDGNYKETDSNAPYKFNWKTSNYANGSHTIKATAYDTANQTKSDEITVTVSNRKSAQIDISFSPNPVYPSGDGKWYYKITLKETSGIGAWLTSMDTNPGTWQGGTPRELFGTNYIGPYGQLSANLVSSGFSGNVSVTYYLWGYDANGNTNLSWKGSVELRSFGYKTSTFSNQWIHEKDKSGLLK